MKKLATLSFTIFVASSAVAAAQTALFVAGKVVKIDTSAGKVTIDHQKIPNLDMEPMTMVFRAADPALLKAVKAGDRIRFKADTVNGQLTVTTIEKAK
ncbi:MAG: copper-binding protein [Methylobacteriaceae bacterium]|nr:copper-binding protein [Methylobacteriaceae bacterium]